MKYIYGTEVKIIRGFYFGYTGIILDFDLKVREYSVYLNGKNELGFIKDIPLLLQTCISVEEKDIERIES